MRLHYRGTEFIVESCQEISGGTIYGDADTPIAVRKRLEVTGEFTDIVDDKRKPLITDYKVNGALMTAEEAGKKAEVERALPAMVRELTSLDANGKSRLVYWSDNNLIVHAALLPWRRGEMNIETALVNAVSDLCNAMAHQQGKHHNPDVYAEPDNLTAIAKDLHEQTNGCLRR